MFARARGKPLWKLVVDMSPVGHVFPFSADDLLRMVSAGGARGCYGVPIYHRCADAGRGTRYAQGQGIRKKGTRSHCHERWVCTSPVVHSDLTISEDIPLTSLPLAGLVRSNAFTKDLSNNVDRLFRREGRTPDERSHRCRLQPLQDESRCRLGLRLAPRKGRSFHHRRSTISSPRRASSRPKQPRAAGQERRPHRCRAHDRCQPDMGRASGNPVCEGSR